MNKELIYFITKEIKDIYINMSINETDRIDNKDNILKLKKLILVEDEFYNNLSYDDALSLFTYYINNNDNNNKDNNNDLIGRILNKLNDLFDDKYFYNFTNNKLNVDNMLHSELYNALLDSGELKKIVSCKKYVFRDIRLLSIYMLKKMEINGYISNEYYIGSDFCKTYRISHSYVLMFFYSDLEKEYLNNNCIFNKFNLISNLAYQLQKIPYYYYTAAKEDVLNEELKIVVDEYNKLSNSSLTDDSGLMSLMYLVSMVNALIVIDDNVISYLKHCLIANENNNEIYNIIIDNIYGSKKEKKNIKYLSLVKNDKYY